MFTFHIALGPMIVYRIFSIKIRLLSSGFFLVMLELAVKIITHLKSVK